MKKILQHKTVCFMLACLGAFGFTSCLDSDKSGITNTALGFATIVNTDNGKQRFYVDGDLIANFDGTYDVDSLKDIRRAYISFAYNEEHLVVKGNEYYVTGELLSVYEIRVSDILTKTAAEEAKITEADSIYAYNTMQFWTGNGYLTTICSTPYVKERPTISFYYDETQLPSDTLRLKMTVNRHSKDNVAGTATLYESFRLEPLKDYFRDSLYLSVQAEGKDNPAILKIAKRDMIEPEHR